MDIHGYRPYFSRPGDKVAEIAETFDLPSKVVPLALPRLNSIHLGILSLKTTPVSFYFIVFNIDLTTLELEVIYLVPHLGMIESKIYINTFYPNDKGGGYT